MPDGYVIDNSVLSACYRQNWMELLRFRSEEYDILVSRYVWGNEFLEQHTDASPPSWIRVVEAARYPYFPDAPRSIGVGDLTCLGVAHEYSYAAVTNDKQFYRRAIDGNIEVYWGTDFLIQSFLDCGIPQDQFDAGKEDYVEDVYLPDKTTKQVLRSEKG